MWFHGVRMCQVRRVNETKRLFWSSLNKEMPTVKSKRTKLSDSSINRYQLDLVKQELFNITAEHTQMK